MTDEVQLREFMARLDERLKALAQSTGEQFGYIRTKLDRLAQADDKRASKDDLAHFATRVESLEKSRTWLVRSIIGAGITAGGSIITAIVVAAKKAGVN